MAVSVAILATELRLHADPDSPPPEPMAGTLARTLRASQAIVDERVRDDTPTAIRDLAVIAVASYVFDRPSAASGTRFSNAWGNSGAEAMLSKWIDHQIGVIGGKDDPEPEAEAEPMILIDATLTAASPTSAQAQGDGRQATIQVISTVSFAVDIEASFLEDGAAVQWDRVLPVIDADIFTGDRRLTLSPLLVYRARLLSGGPVRVLLG